MSARGFLDRATDALARTVGIAADAMFVRRAFRSPTLTVTDAVRVRVRQRLRDARTFYADANLFQPVDAAAPDREDAVGRLRGGRRLDVTFQTPYHGLHPEFRQTLRDIPQVGRVRARWFRHDAPAPAVIVLHGWAMGNPQLDSHAFAARALFNRGVDVVLIPAPFHGTRLPPGRMRPMFPTSRPVRATEGFAMWIAEARALGAMLRERGAARVGVFGMSMGGFTAALLATVAPEMDFVLPTFPFASLPRLMWEQAEHIHALDNARRLGVDRPTFEAAFDAIAPLKRELAVPSVAVHVFGNRYDRVTPISHARALAEHFGSPYTELSASHLVQLQRREVFREILRRSL